MKLLLPLTFFVLISLQLFAQPKNKPFELAQDAPSIEVKDQNGNEIVLEHILKESKVLLVFYRGSWCGYCTKHLSMLQKNLEEISKSGTRVLVVTPEKPEFIKDMVEQTEAKFSVINDVEGQIMKDYNVGFQLNEENLPKFYKLTVSNALDYNSKANTETLPIPATFIINQEGTFDYIQFDADYSKRSSMDEIFKHLKTKKIGKD